VASPTIPGIFTKYAQEIENKGGWAFALLQGVKKSVQVVENKGRRNPLLAEGIGGTGLEFVG